MPIVAGIDEAGYGPTLGPLVVAATIWRVRPEHIDADLWRVLGECVGRAAQAADSRLAVDDSKHVYDRKRGIHTLERSVLAFAAAAGAGVSTVGELLVSLGASAAATGLPWERDLARTLPLDERLSQFAAIAERLARVQNAAGAVCERLAARVVSPADFNRRVERTHNKSAVLIEQVLTLLVRIVEHAGREAVFVHVDRLGGRADYRALLATTFPQRHLREVVRSPECSRYVLSGSGGEWQIDFVVDADRTELPVSLASMTAKYVRELLMAQFNAFWAQQMPGLAPTAGYYADAQRFLSQIQPLLPKLGISAEQFIRAR